MIQQLDRTGWLRDIGIGNRAAGVALVQGAYANTIGGNSNARNVISSNVLDGIALYDTGTSASSTIKTLNLFGTRADGTGFLPNWRWMSISAASQVRPNPPFHRSPDKSPLHAGLRQRFCHPDA